MTNKREYGKAYALAYRSGMANRSPKLSENLARIAEALGCEPDCESIAKAVAEIRRSNIRAREEARKQVLKDYPCTTRAIIGQALEKLDKKK